MEIERYTGRTTAFESGELKHHADVHQCVAFSSAASFEGKPKPSQASDGLCLNVNRGLSSPKASNTPSSDFSISTGVG